MKATEEFFKEFRRKILDKYETQVSLLLSLNETAFHFKEQYPSKPIDPNIFIEMMHDSHYYALTEEEIEMERNKAQKAALEEKNKLSEEENMGPNGQQVVSEEEGEKHPEPLPTLDEKDRDSQNALSREKKLEEEIASYKKEITKLKAELAELKPKSMEFPEIDQYLNFRSVVRYVEKDSTLESERSGLRSFVQSLITSIPVEQSMADVISNFTSPESMKQLPYYKEHLKPKNESESENELCYDGLPKHLNNDIINTSYHGLKVEMDWLWALINTYVVKVMENGYEWMSVFYFLREAELLKQKNFKKFGEVMSQWYGHTNNFKPCTPNLISIHKYMLTEPMEQWPEYARKYKDDKAFRSSENVCIKTKHQIKNLQSAFYKKYPNQK